MELWKISWYFKINEMYGYILIELKLLYLIISKSTSDYRIRVPTIMSDRAADSTVLVKRAVKHQIRPPGHAHTQPRMRWWITCVQDTFRAIRHIITLLLHTMNSIRGKNMQKGCKTKIRKTTEISWCNVLNSKSAVQRYTHFVPKNIKLTSEMFY